MVHRRMPAEWEPHEKTIIQWPEESSMVYPENYQEVCAGYEETIRAIAEFEPVGLIVAPEEEESLRLRMGDVAQFYPIAHNDAWARDSVPTVVLDEDGNRLGINWTFNAWGGKYEPWDLDDALGGKILSMLSIPEERAKLVMEGGSIHSDGNGTILTTKECLLNPNRNPELSQEDIEKALKKRLGAEKIIWLEKGLDGDETDGHVDNIACFAQPGKVILQVCSDPEDPNYAITRRALEILEGERDAKGRDIEVIPVPQPPMETYRGKRATLSYLNFYLVNGGLILPIFGGAATNQDKQAREILEKAFPDRRVVTVNGWALVKEGGNVHCITQQIPQERKRQS